MLDILFSNAGVPKRWRRKDVSNTDKRQIYGFVTTSYITAFAWCLHKSVIEAHGQIQNLYIIIAATTLHKMR